LDILSYNRQAWNRKVERGNAWTIPVTAEEVASARLGTWQILLTPTKFVPKAWFPTLRGLDILCLASGGGQQGPLLAAAGARVTVFDNSPAQLAQDRLVAERDSLQLDTIQGDMADLSVFPDDHFDLIFHPVSNVFVPKVRPVWSEAFRVLRPGGFLLAGFDNPLIHIFDADLMDEKGHLEVRYAIPYSDLTSLSDDKRSQQITSNNPLEFGHSLEDQIGGQLEAGFFLSGFYEDIDPTSILSKYIPSYIATRAFKPIIKEDMRNGRT
jgi:SAM-dependent methyltransferase